MSDESEKVKSPLFAYRFLIPAGEWKKLPENPELSVSDAYAVAVATSKEEALAMLDEFAKVNGITSTWIRLARFETRPIPGVVWWSGV